MFNFFILLVRNVGFFYSSDLIFFLKLNFSHPCCLLHSGTCTETNRKGNFRHVNSAGKCLEDLEKLHLKEESYLTVKRIKLNLINVCFNVQFSN